MALSRTLANFGDSLGGANNTLYVDGVNGLVGIGTSSPGTKLNVYSSSAINTFIRPQNTLGYVDFGALSDGSIYGGYAAPASGTGVTLGTSNSTYWRVLTNATEALRIDTSGNLLFNSGYGSAATAYGCRAWINYNGTAATIRASANVTSVTKNATGDYTMNLTNAMPDVNYCMALGGDYSNTRGDSVSGHNAWPAGYAASTTQVNIQTCGASAYYDLATISLAVFR